MSKKLKILMLEDNIDDVAIIQRLLLNGGMDCEFKLALNKHSFLNDLYRFKPDIILADNSLPQFTASDALKAVHLFDVSIPFIMVTGTAPEEFAIDIIKQGADDYILKDRLIRLPAAIATAIKKQKILRDTLHGEEEIKRSNERFQTLSAATKDAVWDWDVRTGEVWWSANFFRLLGYDETSRVPELHEWTKKIHPLDREKVIARFTKIESNAAHASGYEFRLQFLDGSYHTVLDKTYLFKDSEGTPLRVIGVLVDITEQKRLIQEIEVLSLIAKETTNSVIIFDSKTRNTSWVNEGFTRATGFTKEDMVGMDPWLILGLNKEDDGIMNYIRRQMADHLAFSSDMLLYTKTREAKWQFVCGQPIRDAHDNASNYFIIATDISERRKLEEGRLTDKIKQQKEITRIILQTQEVERNLLGRELHDNINQMLAAVNLKLAYYLEDPENNISIVHDCREIIKKAINETRNLSHIMVMPRFSEKSLSEELRILVDNYSYKKEVHLDVSGLCDKNISPSVKETLFRIAQEQLSNIIKHAKANKVVIILSNDLKLVTMVISDNGIGFDLIHGRRGIGLTNIFSRVEPYSGKAEITTRPGKGCTLSVTIPLPAECIQSK